MYTVLKIVLLIFRKAQLMDNISLLKNYLKKGKIFKLFLNAKWCGRRCLAALNKFHKIQQNEIERIRGTVLIRLLHVWSRHKQLFWTPLVISYKKYIYWKLFMHFIRVWLTSSIMESFFAKINWIFFLSRNWIHHWEIRRF